MPEEQSDAVGPADSHEAMNGNGQTATANRRREKRSYEFLIGLVNNNSKYEVTRVDPSTTVNPEASVRRNTSASEALLELMVKIASHPDQWDRVHKLLQNIDEDLQASKKIVDDIEQKRSNKQPEQQNPATEKRHRTQDNPHSPPKETIYGSVAREPEEALSTHADAENENFSLRNVTETRSKTNNWPEFKQGDQQFGSVKTGFERSGFEEGQLPVKYHAPAVGRNRHHQFEYRVVTDRPFVHSKTPKAYIAVSLIAPKPMEPQEDDFMLESELRQLKPWPIQSDYQDVERTRWAKKSEEDSGHRSP